MSGSSHPSEVRGAGGVLRPLGLPRPLRVRLDARGEPADLTVAARGPQRSAATLPGAARPGASPSGRTHAVERVEEVWRIAEEWWREAPLQRTYYQVLVDGGRPFTLFHDDAAPPEEGWYEQRY